MGTCHSTMILQAASASEGISDFFILSPANSRTCSSDSVTWDSLKSASRCGVQRRQCGRAKSPSVA